MLNDVKSLKVSTLRWIKSVENHIEHIQSDTNWDSNLKAMYLESLREWRDSLKERITEYDKRIRQEAGD